MKFVYNDGGRLAAGYRGKAGDCVTRAIAIATGLPYSQIYQDLNRAAQSERRGSRKRSISSARDGVYKRTQHRYLASLGWTWTPTMLIGSGCKVHLADGELPAGRLIVSVSKHLTAVIDGVIHDTHDPQRGETFRFDADGTYVKLGGGRCVYGYFQRAEARSSELCDRP